MQDYQQILKTALASGYAASTLTPQEYKVLRLYSGTGVQPHATNEIAAHLDMTPDEVQAIETAALAKLRLTKSQ